MVMGIISTLEDGNISNIDSRLWEYINQSVHCLALWPELLLLMSWYGGTGQSFFALSWYAGIYRLTK